MWHWCLGIAWTNLMSGGWVVCLHSCFFLELKSTLNNDLNYYFKDTGGPPVTRILGLQRIRVTGGVFKYYLLVKRDCRISKVHFFSNFSNLWPCVIHQIMLHIQLLIKRGHSVIEKSEKSIQVFSYISFNRETFTENKYLSDRI